MSESYEYDVELDDEKHCLQFGKYKDMTPAQLASIGTGRTYLIWAWKNTSRWVGSEELIRKVFREQEEQFVERAKVTTSKPAAGSVEEFERAVYEAYGAFPKPLWMY